MKLDDPHAVRQFKLDMGLGDEGSVPPLDIHIRSGLEQLRVFCWDPNHIEAVRATWTKGSRKAGICPIFSFEPHLPWSWLFVCFASWPHFSGDHYFPVPGIGVLRPNLAPNKAYVRWNRWSRFTKYGRLRRDLLKHVIHMTERATKWIQDNDPYIGVKHD